MANDLKKEILTCLDPNNSVVVKSCAGSGKTWLLSSRIVRILIENPKIPFNSILAITFTENAAYEIKERITKRLYEIAFCNKKDYKNKLDEIGLNANKYKQESIQSLYERFILTVPSISVYTFHSWFNHIISFLPWSSRISLNNKIEPNTERLKDEAWQNTLLLVAENQDYQNTLRQLLGFHKLKELQKLCDQVIEHRLDWFMHFGCTPEDDECIEKFLKQIEENLPLIENSLSIEEFVNNVKINEYINIVRIELANSTSKKYTNVSQEIEKLQQDLSSTEKFDLIKNVFFTKTNTVRKIFVDLINNNILPTKLESIINTIEDTVEYENCIINRKYNKLCVVLAQLYAKSYFKLKQIKGVIDYADMELIPIKALLEGSSIDDNQNTHINSPALLDLFFNMDSTYKHVLIDEFQDSNPAQWAMLQAWLDCSSGSDNQPKVFIVGDPKQSIYSFRHGDPRLLTAAYNYLKNPYYQGTLVEFNTTRRCSQSVLDLVNNVFSIQKIENYVHHKTLSKSSGVVQFIEPKLKKSNNDKTTNIEKIRNPLKLPLEEDDADLFATKEALLIADYLDQIVNKIDLVNDDGTTKTCSIDDVMILHPTRIGIEGLVQKLTERGYPCVAQNTNSRLIDLECQDMIALLHAIFDPAYGLALIQVLRSPIFFIDEDDIWKIYQTGSDNNINACDWIKGFENTKGSKNLSNAQKLINQWRNYYINDRLTVHELLMRVYEEGDIINKYTNSVPIQIKKRVTLNLEWILNYCHEADNGEYISLNSYINYLKEMATSNESLTDEIEMSGVVRIMSVHKAKGLESPVVIIINSNHQNRRTTSSLLVNWDTENILTGPSHISFNRSKKVATQEQLKIIDDKEYIKKQEELNMLYVALTRAKNNLLVSIRPSRKTPPIKWGEFVKLSLENLNAITENNLLTYKNTNKQNKPKEIKLDSNETTMEDLIEVSDYKTGVHKRHVDMPVRIGDMFHYAIALKLYGCNIDQDVQKYFGISELEFRDINNLIDKVLNPKTDFSKLLNKANNFECEVPAITELGISYRIDCIIYTKNELWVLDFKTGENINVWDYEEQLYTYFEIVSENEPDKKIKVGVVKTDGSIQTIEFD